MIPELVGPGELAHLCGISRERIRQLRHEGRLPPAAPSSHRYELYRVADVRAWCERTGRSFNEAHLEALGR